MGKCVSKDQHLKLREIDERSYVAISDEFEYYDYHYGGDDEGQSESKKSTISSSNKMHGPETRGTKIKFGFKKKSFSSANNKKLNAANNNINNNNEIREKDEKKKAATIISNFSVIEAEQSDFVIAGDDNNGNNTTNLAANNDINIGDKQETGRTTPKLQPAKRDQLAVGRNNRFGFRQNVVRPVSNITPKFSDDYDTVNNNYSNNNIVSANDNDKRKLKSTIAAQRTKFLAQHPVSVRFDESSIKSSSESEPAGTDTKKELNSQQPTSQSQTVVLSRYTLHSSSLPRPQYATTVSVQAPISQRSTTFNTFSNASTRPLQNVQSKLIDTKGAKHQANLNRKGGMMTRRDESLDSGIASHDSASDHHQQHDPVFLRRPNQRSRRFEMVPSTSRHKFEIRDLNDFNESSVVVPLSLPKLPTERREIVTNGLIRSTNSYNTDETDMSISGDSRPTSLISTASEAESCEEEKLRIDNSYSEKSLKGAISKQNAQQRSKHPSPVSSKTSWSGNGGESLASKDGFSSVSASISTDDDGKIRNTHRKKDIDCDEDELSSMTITAENSSIPDSKISPSKDQKETVNDAFMRQQMQPKMGSISRKELFIQVDETKFAETVAAAKTSAMLDDETSPSESLVSSSESGDVLMKKVDDFIKSEKPFDDIKEQDLEDITPELISPGSPTHASNSLSLSDGGRDFFIDDEIAGQPALMISDKKQKGTSSHHDDYKSSSIAINAISDGTTTTPTLKDISLNANGSLKSLNKALPLKNIKSDQSSPVVVRKKIERSGSLDTLSPCDSIASDDLMGDFDFASSLDSIDRHEQFVEDLRLYSETDGKQSVDLKEYEAILKTQNNMQRRQNSRENITSQLPARATRLLNRRLQNNNNSPLSLNGSESPRSLDSMHSRTSARTSLREHLKQRQQLNLQAHLLNSSSEDLVGDKTLRNAMLQDVTSFKNQLVQLRRILQEDEDKLMMSDTLNPFEMNGQVFSNLYNGNLCEDQKEILNDKEKKDDEKNMVLTNEQLMLLEDQRQELADLRRQVVFLQSQMDDKDRIIKLQQSKLEQIEAEKAKMLDSTVIFSDETKTNIETANCATQTERLRPMSMGQDFTSPLEPPKPNEKLNDATAKSQQQIPTITVKPSPPRSKTQISSVYTKLSSIKPTNGCSLSVNSTANKNSSIPNNYSAKPMKTTKIEYPKVSPAKMQSASNVIRGSELKSPAKRSIPTLVKPATLLSNGTNKNSSKAPTRTLTTKSKTMSHLDDSNGNSATSSLSTSSSNSSLNISGADKEINLVANQLQKLYNRGIID